MDYCMPVVLCTRYSLDAQGYDIFDHIVYQDNKSAIILENNSKSSSRKRMKHINTRYYFVTDFIERYELSTYWVPTSDIIGYFI